MKNRPIIRSVGIIIVFCAIAFIIFTENVSTAKALGLFACGAVVGVSLTKIISELRAKSKQK